MKYMLLIYEAEKSEPELDEAEMARWFAVTDEMREAGVLRGGDALHPTASATTVRVQGGKAVHSDGPFAETKEQLGGYYLLEVADLDEALRWAAKMPNAHRGSIEVRPVIDFEQG